MREDEIKLIKKIKNIERIIQDQKNFEVNFKDVDDKYFFDIKNQRKASSNVRTWVLYCALGFSGFRKLRLSKSNFISLIAYFFSIFCYDLSYSKTVEAKAFSRIRKTKLYIMKLNSKADTILKLTKYSLNFLIPETYVFKTNEWKVSKNKIKSLSKKI